jgi:hypothetical protein
MEKSETDLRENGMCAAGKNAVCEENARYVDVENSLTERRENNTTREPPVLMMAISLEHVDRIVPSWLFSANPGEISECLPQSYQSQCKDFGQLFDTERLDTAAMERRRAYFRFFVVDDLQHTFIRFVQGLR